MTVGNPLHMPSYFFMTFINVPKRGYSVNVSKK
mgnify:CR=1 FL=1